MKKNKNIISVITIAILLILLIPSNVFADFSGLNQISNPTGVGALNQAAGKILSVIYAVAVAISVGMMLVIGIKYMTSSPDQKANLKSRAIPYLIGAVLVFGTANILNFISKMAGWIK